MPECGKLENFPREGQGVTTSHATDALRCVHIAILMRELLSETGNLGRASRSTKVSAHMVLPKSRCMGGSVGVSMRNGPQLNPVYTASLASAS